MDYNSFFDRSELDLITNEYNSPVYCNPELEISFQVVLPAYAGSHFGIYL